jgi:D-alanine-D-alanine ligase
MNEPISASAQPKVRVAVVFGGRSSEHAISCVTAGSVMKALDPERYEVVPVVISTDGRWVLAEGIEEQLAISDGALPPRIDETSGALVTMAADPTARELTVHEPGTMPKALGEVDVVLPLLHGPYGEDGTLQGMLELAGVPYVGSGVLASAVGMDKDVMKRLMVASGLPVGPYVTLRANRWDTDPEAVRAQVARLGYPAFVKPARAGSSMGISKVHDEDGLAEAIAFARGHDPKLVIEATLHGREIEVGVLAGRDGGRAEASLPAELKVHGDHEFYDFNAKYMPDGGTTVELPAALSEEQTAEIRRLAVEAFEALECEGLARVDFFLLEDGGRFVINEINTMPGFTTTSMFPQMWAATGVSYAELVDRLISEALSRPDGLR